MRDQTSKHILNVSYLKKDWKWVWKVVVLVGVGVVFVGKSRTSDCWIDRDEGVG